MARELIDAASGPYRAAGPLAYYFARGKLRHDPVFLAILARGLLAHRRRILDLGCGQGLLAAWLSAARRVAGPGAWPDTWAAPPMPAAWRGIDLVNRYIRRARIALGPDADCIEGDVREADFGRADGIVIIDLLQYIEYADQRGILRRVHGALSSEGVLLLRIGNAAGGIGFTLATWVDRMGLLACGHGLKRLHCRSTAEWRGLLSEVGFDSEILPMSAGTPFANDLIVARPR